MLSHEKLLCLGTGTELTDDGLVLSNDLSSEPAFLRTMYNNKRLRIREELPGIFRFLDWLPVNRILEGDGYPVTYKSEGLAEYLDLSRLYITFNGYWPEKGAFMKTVTFKECEAYSVCARFPEDTGKVLVIASAGNTARSFMEVGSENNIPLVLVVPEQYIYNLWSTKKINSCVKIIAAGGNSDYYDAIYLSQLICSIDGFYPEGGAKNVARRDGMGTTVLSAVTFIGDIPDYYFQAIGSGTGAISAYESNLRFNESGMYNKKNMSLQVSQNEPFVPIYKAWKSGSNIIEDLDEETALKQIDMISAKVLSNRKPPYSIRGGLYETLLDTDGDVLTATNEEAYIAQKLFMKYEGCDICPEAGVALASLVKKVEKGDISKDATILINITGGGTEKLKTEFSINTVEPDIVIQKQDFNIDTVNDKMRNLF